jgi:hypothetical protein
MALFRPEGGMEIGGAIGFGRSARLSSNRPGIAVSGEEKAELLSDCFEMAAYGVANGVENENPENRFSEAISGAWNMVGATGIEPVTPTMST